MACKQKAQEAALVAMLQVVCSLGIRQLEGLLTRFSSDCQHNIWHEIRDKRLTRFQQDS